MAVHDIRTAAAGTTGTAGFLPRLVFIKFLHVAVGFKEDYMVLLMPRCTYLGNAPTS